jgi:hypothetical protein
MSNINWGQIINNFASAMNNNVANFAAKNSNILGAGPQMYNPPQPTQTQQQPVLPQTTEQLAKTTAELALLNQQQNVNMLKDLLKLPKNFEQLLNQITTTPDKATQKTALLLITSTLNTAELSALLQSSSKDAMSNLYKMLAQFNQVGMTVKDEQTAELSKLISFVAASATSDVQSVRTAMLMYLPWLPLTDPNAFKLEIGNKGGEEEKEVDDYITIMIQTENYGNLQADIYRTKEDGLLIQVTSSETFPQKDFIALMSEESKKYSVDINLDMTQKAAFNKDKNEKKQTEVFINVSSGINPFLLLISNSVIRTIHIIDEKENLREQRKEKINGES